MRFVVMWLVDRRLPLHALLFVWKQASFLSATSSFFIILHKGGDVLCSARVLGVEWRNKYVLRSRWVLLTFTDKRTDAHKQQNEKDHHR